VVELTLLPVIDELERAEPLAHLVERRPEHERPRDVVHDRHATNDTTRAMPKRHRPGASATSTIAHVEEVVLATSGEDAFELVFSVAAHRMDHPELAERSLAKVDKKLLARIESLLAPALDHVDALDAIFEALVSRVAKGQKGQFFTPRTVVDFVIRTLAPKKGEVVVDPACGSGAFLAHALMYAGGRVVTRGCDVDARAVRVAKLLALAGGTPAESIVRDDGLRTAALERGRADVVATNPPFAGRADPSGFEVARLVRTPERDVLFLERSLDLLRPGGRLGIVLPYNKAAGQSFARLRRWLFDRARITEVVGLPRETFLPHTSQRCFVLFAEKRMTGPSPRERIRLALSEQAGKDSGGEPNGKKPDLDRPARVVTRQLADLGDDLVLAPERHLVAASSSDGIPLGDLVTERKEHFDPKRLDGTRIVVVDTTHAKDGLLDLVSAARVTDAPKSNKKRALEGDLIISRLRPYLRQVALVTAAEVAVSTEFYVLRPKKPDDDLAWLLPFLLSSRTQSLLAAAQEGGHHPRVPRASLFALRVPTSFAETRKKTSRTVRTALEALHQADRAYRRALTTAPS
jgi:SAM-dependent methyltransferase